MGRKKDEKRRAMYAGGRANADAMRFNRLWNRIIRWGVTPRSWVTLEVAGRRSGKVSGFPLVMVRVDREWYLVSMLGECNWVLNVRAAGGRAVLRGRRARPVTLVEVPVADRAPIIKRYLDKAPGARPHIRVDRREPVQTFEAIAADHPVFRVSTSAG